MDGIFVTGTDTSVGKTTVAAGLLKLLHGYKPTAYWKPIQTGTVIGDDTHEVAELTELEASVFLKPAYRFAEPVAPYQAALQWKQTIDLDEIAARFEDYKKDTCLIVEGAGGLLVPLTETALQDTLIKQLGLPVIIVAPNQLGTINHTLLTIEHCRKSGIEIVGVVLARAKQAKALGNVDAITRYGQVEVLAEFDESGDRRSVVAAVSAHPRLRRLFGVAELPK